MHRLFRWIGKEEGATAVEYAIMLSLIVIVCLGALGLMGTALRDSFIDSTIEIESYFGS